MSFDVSWTGTVNLREHFCRALLGKEVDRPAIWLREGFDFLMGSEELERAPFGWQRERLYQELWEFARPHCVMQCGWSPGGHFNRCLGVPPSRIQRKQTLEPDGAQLTETTIETPGGPLTSVTKRIPGLNTSWKLKPLAESREDLENLLAVPFEVEPVHLERYRQALEKAGDRAIPWLSISSPIVVISGCLTFQDFLLLSHTERAFFHELLEEITRRWLTIIEAVFKEGPLETFVTIGGSEQCTPPMMHADAYDELVVPYDGRIVEALRGKVMGVNCHCHGKVRHALKGMLEMGMDSTDPVEPPPAGDLSIREARENVGDRMTLVGNFEFDELETRSPEYIRERTREILSVGPRRLVLAASAGPISRVSPALAANYRAWLETVLEEGNVRT